MIDRVSNGRRNGDDMGLLQRHWKMGITIVVWIFLLGGWWRSSSGLEKIVEANVKEDIVVHKDLNGRTIRLEEIVKRIPYIEDKLDAIMGAFQIRYQPRSKNQ
jgi:hypothetical protein